MSQLYRIDDVSSMHVSRVSVPYHWLILEYVFVNRIFSYLCVNQSDLRMNGFHFTCGDMSLFAEVYPCLRGGGAGRISGVTFF